MSPERREQWFKVISTAALVYLEWYAMEPYHPSLYAAVWNWIMRVCRKLATFFGHYALYSEVQYYQAVNSGN
jgi:hypothetical protein